MNDNGGTAGESAWTLTANGGAAGTLSGPGARAMPTCEWQHVQGRHLRLVRIDGSGGLHGQ